MEQLAGHVAVITGGGAGIGRALALAFADEGMHIAVADIAADAAGAVAAEVIARGVRAIAVETDVTQRASLDALAERAYGEFGAVHLVCANAGVGAFGPIDQVRERNWRWVFAVNVEGVIHTVQAFVPRLRAQEGERHLMITASVAGLTAPGPDTAYYAMTKHLLVGYAEGARGELSPLGIGVSVLCPGLVNTRIWDSASHRPEAFGGPRSLPEATGERWRSHGMSAEEVARRAVDGVRRGDFYIIVPGAGAAAEIEARHAEIMAALGRAAAE